MSLVLLYKCDSDECECLAPIEEVKYLGKYPRGWFRVSINAHGIQPADTGQNAKAFCSSLCILTYYNAHIAEQELARGHKPEYHDAKNKAEVTNA